MTAFHFLAQTSSLDNLIELRDRVGLDLPHLISNGIAFTLVAVALTYFAYNPVRRILEERRQAIAQSMAEADRIKQELAEAQEARVQVLKKANEQAEAIIAEAHKTAASRTEQAAREATVQAEEIVTKAREASVLERDRLLTELKREVGMLVIRTTEKIAGKVLTPDDQSRLNNETLRQLGAGNN